MKGFFMRHFINLSIIMFALSSSLFAYQPPRPSPKPSSGKIIRVPTLTHPLNTIFEESKNALEKPVTDQKIDMDKPLTLAKIIPQLKAELKKVYVFGSFEYKRAVEICLTRLFEIELVPGTLISRPRERIKQLIDEA